LSNCFEKQLSEQSRSEGVQNKNEDVQRKPMRGQNRSEGVQNKKEDVQRTSGGIE
jgi:hypothetical protein